MKKLLLLLSLLLATNAWAEIEVSPGVLRTPDDRFEDLKDYSKKITEKLKKAIKSKLSKVQSIVISDYGKGVCTLELCQFVITEAKKLGIIVIVDPNFFFN